MANVGNLYMATREVFRQYQYEKGLRQVSRLKGKESEIEPALSTLRHGRRQEKEDEQGAHGDEQGHKDVASLEERPVDEACAEEDTERDAEPDNLLLEEIVALDK